MLWVCPLCREPLLREDNSLVCSSRHCFDLAREGYVNLLPVNRKRSREPGDSREMIDARRRVHAADLYRPLVDALCNTLAESADTDACLLDLGCGEGYYSQAVQATLPAASLYGVDIAKPAVRLAAKSCRGGHFAVAGAFDVPLPDESMDAVISVFAPASNRELARLLKPGGRYLRVTPGPDHLWQLRQLLYDEPRRHRQDCKDIPGLSVESVSSESFPLDLAGGLLHDLVAMTPYAYGGQRENKVRLDGLAALTVQADFVLTRYRSPIP